MILELPTNHSRATGSLHLEAVGGSGSGGGCDCLSGCMCVQHLKARQRLKLPGQWHFSHVQEPAMGTTVYLKMGL